MASAMGLSLSTVTAQGHRAMAGGRRRSKMEPESCCFDLRRVNVFKKQPLSKTTHSNLIFKFFWLGCFIHILEKTCSEKKQIVGSVQYCDVRSEATTIPAVILPMISLSGSSCEPCELRLLRLRELLDVRERVLREDRRAPRRAKLPAASRRKVAWIQ